MIFDQPHIYEIEDMMEFVKQYKQIYIYGCGDNQEYLLKFFDICGIPIKGYVVTYLQETNLKYRQMPIKLVEDVVKEEGTGIVIGLSDRYFNVVIPNLRRLNFSDYFIMSEHNKRTIAHKLRPRNKDLMWIEINLVDHCNLNCQMCDHFSQLVTTPFLLDIKTFERDMNRLAELCSNDIGIIKLQGGEPTIHPDLIRFIEITRQLFPKCTIYLFTNGLLLNRLSCEFWQACKDNDITLQLTTYPININVKAIEEKACNYGVKLQVFAEVANRLRGVKHSTKHPFDLEGKREKYEFICCYHLNETITLRDGKLYTCSIRPYANYFNDAFNQKLVLSEEDGIDIHSANNYEEIAEFVARRIPFCNYCDIKNRKVFKWARSKKTICEYI